MQTTGTLYIVSTPIGNLKDITFRAVEILKSADLIACEDTRRTKKLLNNYNINAPLTSYFEYNKIKKADYIIETLIKGKSVALVSDAGTPGISDPGYLLISRAIKHDIKTESVPGPSAIISSLVVSGLPVDRFVFEGFLPNKSAARKKKLQTFANETRTIIFYESVHRIIKTLADITEVLGNINLVCVRELTKKFEEIKRGRAKQVLEYFSSKKPKGEFVILINMRKK